MSKRPHLTAEEERVLVIKAQAGDIAARDRLIVNILPILYREAHRVVKNYPLADPDDLVQDQVCRILGAFHRFDPSRGFRFITYFGRDLRYHMAQQARLNGIVKRVGSLAKCTENTKAQYIRHSGIIPSLDVLIRDEERQDNTIGSLLADHREAGAVHANCLNALRSSVRQCIERIPDRYRRVFRWKFIEGLTLGEIGEILGVTRERVRQIIMEGIRWVRQILLSDPEIREFVAENGSELSSF